MEKRSFSLVKREREIFMIGIVGGGRKRRGGWVIYNCIIAVFITNEELNYVFDNKSWLLGRLVKV